MYSIPGGVSNQSGKCRVSAIANRLPIFINKLCSESAVQRGPTEPVPCVPTIWADEARAPRREIARRCVFRQLCGSPICRVVTCNEIEVRKPVHRCGWPVVQ